MKNFAALLLALTLIAMGSVAQAAAPANAKAVKQHLEFLGYNVIEEGDLMAAVHNDYLNIAVQGLRGGILVTAPVGTTPYAKSHRNEFLDLINDLNAVAVAARYYIDKDGDLAVEGYYPGEYNKATFELFMREFHGAMNQMAERVSTMTKFIK